jgi:diguanylate cyclase (GGDEF)-like protein
MIGFGKLRHRLARLAAPADAHLSPSARRQGRRFWLGMLYTAAIGYVAVLPVVFIYTAWTYDQPNRGWLVLVHGVAMLLMAVLLLLRRVLMVWRFRRFVFYGWSMLSFAFITAEAWLDGGYASPIAQLMILPMIYIALGMPFRPALLCGGFGLLLSLWLVFTADNSIHSGIMLMGEISLLVGYLIALVGAVFRERQNADLERLRARLEYMAATDELTGCLNKRAFDSALSAAISQAARHRRELSLLVLDVDFFKQVNDRHGHIIGDEVLRQVGAVLRETARESDTVGRPGGDELALLALETDREGAYRLAERIQQALATRSLPMQVTLSIGICTSLPDTEQASTFFRRADQALYAAKNKGRNCVMLWDSAAAGGPFCPSLLCAQRSEKLG